MGVVDDSSFGIIDYCFFAAMLLISLAIGAVATCRGNNSPEEFLMGNRSFGPIPVALSLLTSFVSAISLLGFSGETYAYGMQIVWFIVGVVLGIGAAAITILPVIYPLRLTSINEYLRLRFNSTRLCQMVTIITTIKGILYMGIALYAPTVALATVTPLTSFSYILILGCVVTLYSSTGGIRAVIWTDVFQLTVMQLGLLVIVVVGCYEVGGPSRVWNTALEGGRLEIFEISPSVYVRHTVWNTILFGFFLCFSFFGVSQVIVQRLCTVPTMRDAQKALLINILGMVLIYLLIFIAGVILYAAYADCDPWTLGLIKKKEEILPHFMVDRLNFIIGLPGVFVATIVGGALSSLSSAMNALVAMIWKDFLSQLKIFADLKPRTAGVVNIIQSFVIGGIVIGAAFLSTRATNLVQLSFTISSATLGPILGTFVLGLFFPKTNGKGVWTGLIVSLALNGWISAGAFLYKETSKPLLLSIEKCSPLVFNGTVDDESGISAYHLSYDSSTSSEVLTEEYSNEDFAFMKLYKISYTLYGFVGSVSCIIIGIIASCITGNQDVKEVHPKYVSPLIRRLYWDKEILEETNSEEKLYLPETNNYNRKLTELDLPENKTPCLSSPLLIISKE